MGLEVEAGLPGVALPLSTAAAELDATGVALVAGGALAEGAAVTDAVDVTVVELTRPAGVDVPPPVESRTTPK